MHPFQICPRERGVTLIELMVVIALLAIFATLAVPAMGDMITRQRIKSNAATFANAFTFAQAEAIRRNQPVYVVPGKIKVDGKLNGAATDWDDANAVLVFADDFSKGGAQTAKYDAQEDLRVGNLSNRVTFTLSGRTVPVPDKDDAAVGVGKKIAFVFQANGQMKMKPDFTKRGMGTGGYIGRVLVADRDKPGKYCRVIRIESLGRTAICDDKASRDATNKFCYCGT